jgi:hypothetical protein
MILMSSHSIHVQTDISYHKGIHHFSKIPYTFYLYEVWFDMRKLISVFHVQIYTSIHNCNNQVMSMFYRVMFCVLKGLFLIKIHKCRVLIICLNNYHFKLNNFMWILSIDFLAFWISFLI